MTTDPYRAMPSARAATPSGLSRFASSCLHRIAIAIAKPRPMAFPRFMGWAILWATILGEAGWLGFHPPATVEMKQTALIGAMILIAICKAHDSIKEALQ